MIRSLFFGLAFVAAAAFSGMMVNRFQPFMVMAAFGAVVIFAVAFVNTEWGLYILIFSMLLSPEINVGGTGGASLGRGVTLRVDDFLLAVIGLSWFAKGAYFKELGLFRKTPLNRPIFLYLAVCLVATGAGVLAGRVGAKTGYLFVIKYFEYFIVYFMVVNHVEDEEQIRRFLLFLFLTCAVTAVIGLTQIPGGGRVSAPFEGPEGEPNTYGGYLVFVGMVAAGLFTTARSMKTRVWIGLLLILITPPFLYTQSRSSYLALVPAVLTLGFLTERRALVVSGIVMTLVVSPLFLPSAVKDRIFYTFNQPKEMGQLRIGDLRVDTSTSARLMSWAHALKDWTRHPLLGYGVTGYRFLDAQFPRVLTETGLLGLVAFFYLIYALFRLAFQRLRAVRSPLHAGLIRGFIAGSVGLLFHAIGANTFIIVRIMEPFWLVAGMVAVLPGAESS